MILEVITLINKSNASKYRELFDKANVALGLKTDEEKISSLEEYFSVIRELVVKTGDKKYTMLPLDEDVFEIDANKRLITVPNSFKTNGISVQGDQIAEVVYFKIDRFFDATDLNEMDIFIQWQAPNGDSGISKEWVRDIESENGKLIFGWPLSEEITVKAGNVKFAVRFVKFDESEPNKILYSFSTLTAEAPIKPALDFDISEGSIQPIDYSDLIMDRLTNSSAPIAGAGTSERPEVFLTLPEFVDLIPIEGQDAGEVALHVQARSIDAGNITYEWNYYALTYDGSSGEYVLADVPTEVSNGEIVYLQTKDTSMNLNKDYYLSYTEDKKEVLRLADSSDWAAYIDSEFAGNKVTTIYERYCRFVAKDIGAYNVRISNKRGKAPAYLIPSTKTDENGNVVNETFEELGLVCKVPAPVAPVVSDIHKDSAEGEVLTSFIISEEGADPVELEGGIVPPAEIVLYANAEAADEEYAELSYQWLKDGIAVDGANEETLTISNTEGIYSLKVFNKRNFHVRDVISKTCRISFPPINPIINTPTDNFAVNMPINASSFIVGGTGRVDATSGFKYQWYKENVLGEAIPISDATNAEYTPSVGGIYEVEIFSIYNGKTLSSGTMSDEIRVVIPD